MRIVFLFLIAVLSLFAKPYEIFTNVDENFGVEFKFKLTKDAFIYANKLNILLENDRKINEFIKFPQSKAYKNTAIFDTNFSLIVPFGLIKNSKFFDIVLEISACNKNGLCFEPEIIKFSFQKTNANYKITSQKITQSAEISPNNAIANKISSQNFVLTMIMFFGYGILLSLTPCVLPMIPIISSIIIAKGEQKNALLISLIYVISMAFAYAVAGILAAIFGTNLQIFMQRPATIIAFSVIFALLGISMLGIFSIQAPVFLQNLIDKKIRSISGFFGVAIMGFFSALVVSPCVAAPLAGALVYIAQSANVILGGICLFVMGFAMGLPLLIIGFGSSKYLIKPGIWMNEISKIFAFVMFFMALWMISRIIDANLMLLLYGFLGLFFGVNLAPFKDNVGFFKFRFGLSLCVIIYSIMLILGFGSGAKNVAKPLENFALKTSNLQEIQSLNFKQISSLDEINSIISNTNQPVMLKFSASWCVNCDKMQNEIFSQSDVKKRLENFILLSVDISKLSEQKNEIMAKFGVFGAPTILFFNDKKLAKIITGYVSKDKFLEILGIFS